MTGLLELKAGIVRFVEKNEIYILPIIKFVFALAAFLLINAVLGYRQKLDTIFVPFILAAVCSVLPASVITLFAGVLVLAHLSALSIEVCIVAFMIFFVSFLLYFRLVPGTGFQTVLTPMLFFCKVPYIQPIACGLLNNPYSIVSAMCGTVIYYFLKGVKDNEGIFGAASDEALTSKFVVAINQVFANKELYVVLLAFLAAVIVVYIIRRRAIDNSWTIAIIAGGMSQFLIILLGKFLIGDMSGLIWLIVGSGISILLAFVVEFFMFHLDYSRTERVQFEDDSYYYYVKAVPKAVVQARDMKITKINSKNDKSGEKDSITKESIAKEFDIDKDFLD